LRAAANDAEIAKDAFHRAFNTLAMKTAPPRDYTTVEEAEAEGWTFDTELGRWQLSRELRTHVKRVKEAVAGLTDANVDTMSLAEAQRIEEKLLTFFGGVLGEFTGSGNASLRLGVQPVDVDAEELQGRRRRVKAMAVDLQAKCGPVLKPDMGEAALSGSADSGIHVCHAATCRKRAAVGQKLLVCPCKSVRYCNRACQTADYPIHKAACRAEAEIRRENEAGGGDMNKQHELFEWFQSVPNLVESVACREPSHCRAGRRQRQGAYHLLTIFHSRYTYVLNSAVSSLTATEATTEATCYLPQ
jgi:hypothetical protein